MILLFFIKFSFAFFCVKIMENANDIINTKEDPQCLKISKDDFQYYIYNSIGDEIEININEPNYFQKLKLDISNTSYKSISFKSNKVTSFLFLNLPSKNKINLSLSFTSVAVWFDQEEINIRNLTLFQSPIMTQNAKIKLSVDFLDSDYLSLPPNSVESVFVNNLFTYINSDLEEEHAPITLSNSAKMIFYDHNLNALNPISYKRNILNNNQYIQENEMSGSPIEPSATLFDNNDDGISDESVSPSNNINIFAETEFQTKDNIIEEIISEINTDLVSSTEKVIESELIVKSNSQIPLESAYDLEINENSNLESISEDIYTSETKLDSDFKVESNSENVYNSLKTEDLTSFIDYNTESIAHSSEIPIYESNSELYSEDITNFFQTTSFQESPPFESYTDTLVFSETELETEIPTPDGPHQENKGVYYLNHTLISLNILYSQITATFSNLNSLELYPDPYGRIQIHINSSRITLDYNGPIYPQAGNSVIIFTQTECVFVFLDSWGVLNDENINNIVFIHEMQITLLTQLEEVPYVRCIPVTNVRYVPERSQSGEYCLCLQSRFDECVQNQECSLFSVPIQNYVISSTTSFAMMIADSKAIVINMYLTYSGNENHRLDIKTPTKTSKIINFIAVDEEIPCSLYLQDSNEISDLTIAITCKNLVSVTINFGYNLIATLMLDNSPLILVKSCQIPNLITDTYSLSEFQSFSVTVTNNCIINNSDISYTGVELIIGSNAVLSIMQISNFPNIEISQSSISFSNNDNEFTIFIQDNATIEIMESSSDGTYIPLINFYNYIPLDSKNRIEIRFLLNNSLKINFQRTGLFSNEVSISFIATNILKTLELILTESSINPSPNFKLYPFGTITGNIDLILSTPQTVSSFLNGLYREEFSVFNLSQLSINVMDSLQNITFYNDFFEAVVLNEGATELITFPQSVITSQMTLVTNSSSVLFSLANESIYQIQQCVLRFESENSSIYFDDSFSPSIFDNISSNIRIEHETNIVSFFSGYESVPPILINDPIDGVLYYATTSEYTIYSSQPIQRWHYRSGPKLVVHIINDNGKPIFLNQDEFLAEIVEFKGDPFTLISSGKALTHYSFTDTNITISPFNTTDQYPLLFNANNSESLSQIYYFNATFVLLSNSYISVPYFDVNYVLINIIFNIDNFSSDIKSLSQTDNLISFKCLEFNLNGIDLSKITINENKLLATSNQNENTPFIESDYFVVHYSSNETLYISLKSTNIESEFTFVINSPTSAYIYLDKSFDNVQNAERLTFVVVNRINITIQTELINLPPIRVVNSTGFRIPFISITHEPFFTATASFLFFIAFSALIVIISIILLIISYCYQNDDDDNYEEDIFNNSGKANILEIDTNPYSDDENTFYNTNNDSILVRYKDKRKKGNISEQKTIGSIRQNMSNQSISLNLSNSSLVFSSSSSDNSSSNNIYNNLAQNYKKYEFSSSSTSYMNDD